jgi:hypothetical protein
MARLLRLQAAEAAVHAPVMAEQEGPQGRSQVRAAAFGLMTVNTQLLLEVRVRPRLLSEWVVSIQNSLVPAARPELAELVEVKLFGRIAGDTTCVEDAVTVLAEKQPL